MNLIQIFYKNQIHTLKLVNVLYNFPYFCNLCVYLFPFSIVVWILHSLTCQLLFGGLGSFRGVSVIIW